MTHSPTWPSQLPLGSPETGGDCRDSESAPPPPVGGGHQEIDLYARLCVGGCVCACWGGGSHTNPPCPASSPLDPRGLGSVSEALDPVGGPHPEVVQAQRWDHRGGSEDGDTRETLKHGRTRIIKFENRKRLGSGSDDSLYKKEASHSGFK